MSTSSNVVKKNKEGGLEGIIAGNSEICEVGVGSHGEHSLHYRGYTIEDLASNASFEEVAWLLLRGKLPNKNELATYKEKLRKLRDLPSTCKHILEEIPAHAHMLDVMRTGCSVLGNLEPESKKHDQYAVADRLIACFSSFFLYWYKFHHQKKRADLNSNEDTTAGHILRVLHEKTPNELQKQALNATLILYAEHEFNASTFTVRTIASTLSDFYSAICGGIGALKGPLHGGANEEAIILIQKFMTPEDAENGIKQMLNEKKLVMGFGHRVYKVVDPRSTFVKAWANKLSIDSKDKHLYPIANRIEEVMWDSKHLFPNLDFYSALVFYYLNIPTNMFTPLFATSRISGWSAHLMEQRANNRLIRPLANYIGPSLQKWIPLEKR